MSDAPDPRIPRPVNHCDGFTRSQAIRRALASGVRPVEREWDSRMPIPAGVGDRPPPLHRRRDRRARARLRRRARRAHRRHARRRDRARGDAAAVQQPDPRLAVPAGRARLALTARAGRRSAVREAAPDARGRARLGRAAARGHEPHLAPRGDSRSRTCTTPARCSCSPASATPTRTCRTSPRATTGRSARPTRR